MSPSVARLIVLQDETPLKTIFVSDTPVLIGRSERVQVSVNDPQASRMHAVLWLENGRLWIQDLNSTNGTMLDGRRLEGIESIRQDAELRVGETRIRLEPIAHVQPILWMETIGGEQSWPLDARTHTIGPDNDADIRLDGAPASQLVVRDDGVTMLHVGSRRLPLTLQRSFRLGVLTLRIR
ncbi:MAG: FHA domain-containing protein [Myxococcota bacterium]